MGALGELTSDFPQGNMVIFTCRTADYTSSLRLPEVHIQALNREHMRRYFELKFGPEEAPVNGMSLIAGYHLATRDLSAWYGIHSCYPY